MPLNILVCADLYGDKLNLELVFNSPITALRDLAVQIEASFSHEAQARRPINYPQYPFRVERILIFDDGIRKWRELTAVQSLSMYCQLYVFQPQTSHHMDVVKEIPPPRSGGLVAPSGAGSASNIILPSGRVVYAPGTGANIDPEKVRVVFADLDLDQNGRIGADELRHGYAVRGIEFTVEMIDYIFKITDRNHDGEISFEEFLEFARLYPNATETMYWRLHQGGTTVSRQTEEALRTQRRREFELKDQLQRAAGERRGLENRIRHEYQLAREADPRKRMLEEKEQQLLDWEYMVNQRRDMLHEAERKFAETAQTFDRVAVETNSPRRSRPLY